MIVYTCLTGSHPIIPEQEHFESNIKYIFFHTHDIQNKHGKWHFEKIPIEKNELYTQRKYKILSHELFNKPSAYFDTNTTFKPNLKNKIEECLNKKDYSVAIHPHKPDGTIRKSYLDECCFLLYKGIEYDLIIEMTKYLKNLNYDFSKHDCFLGGQLIRSNSKIVKEINMTWWEMWQKFERRDQLFITPSIRKHNYEIGTFDQFYLRNRSMEYYTFWKQSNLELLPKLINTISILIRNDK